MASTGRYIVEKVSQSQKDEAQDHSNRGSIPTPNFLDKLLPPVEIFYFEVQEVSHVQ